MKPSFYLAKKQKRHWKDEQIMREILFRGKRLDNGQWTEGLLMVYTNKVAQIGTFTDYENYVRCDSSLAVDPKTVGQYTGLLDKNGKRIFEGDIVKRFWLWKEIIYRVKYEEENACFIGVVLNTSGFTIFDYDGEMFEIIGNIYDNPELLKGE